MKKGGSKGSLKSAASAGQLSEVENSAGNGGLVDASGVAVALEEFQLNDRSTTGVLTSHPQSRDIHFESFSLLYHGHELLADTRLELNYGRCAFRCSRQRSCAPSSAGGGGGGAALRWPGPNPAPLAPGGQPGWVGGRRCSSSRSLQPPWLPPHGEEPSLCPKQQSTKKLVLGARGPGRTTSGRVET